MRGGILVVLFVLVAGCASVESPLSDAYIPINEFSDINDVIEIMSNHNLILLGESTHGTQEYYAYRSNISQELITKGFNFIAVEGDWDTLYQLNKYVKGNSTYENAQQVLATFDRWPTWMWNNNEIALLAEWLRDYNAETGREVGFYGFDVYGAERSLKVIHDNSDMTYECMGQYAEDFTDYAHYLAQGGQSCTEEVILAYENMKETNDFYLIQNARVVKNAEKHYRGMITPGPESWNKRVLHMIDTISFIQQHKGEKGIIWAHNTHVGDARATEMVRQGMINKGQILREENKNVFILGFGTYSGNVIAGRSWGVGRESMPIPYAIEGSYEALFKNEKINKGLFIFNETTPELLYEPRPHRAIGVVYNPFNEQGNYVMTTLPERYDAFIFINRTSVLLSN